ncbi:MAG: hypothetical protein IKW64_01920 [Clostridia bacterium]|nr:hypothetical protein [Clostridia bacterium]
MQKAESVLGISKGKYSIAGLNVGMILREGGIIEKQAKEYLCEFEGDPQLVVGLDDEYLTAKNKIAPNLSRLECEYMWTGEQFCTKLLAFDGFMLHASAVVYENKAYLFSAPSGTGKSTHTTLWRKVFGEDKTFILNDDKPVIRLEGEQIIVYGTPWSGKTDWNKNVGVPLQGICFLQRSKDNWIEPISAKDAAFGILNQTIRPQDSGSMSKLLELLDRLLQKATAYKMGCNMEDEAAITAYRGMNP